MESTDVMSAYIGLAGWEENSTKEQWCLPALASRKGVAPTPTPPALILNALGWGVSVGLESLASLGDLSSQVISLHCRCGNCLFQVSAPPTSLYIAISLYP